MCFVSFRLERKVIKTQRLCVCVCVCVLFCFYAVEPLLSLVSEIPIVFLYKSTSEIRSL